MTLTFDLNNVKRTEFGIGFHIESSYNFFKTPIDKNIQKTLHEMILVTWQSMQKISSHLNEYSPAEKHESKEYLYLSIENMLCENLRNLHQAHCLTIDTSWTKDPNQVSCYFARLIDGKNNRLTAMHRAIQFKANLKKLIRFGEDRLEIVNTNSFRLDNDFDILIDDKNIHILRPSAFEILGGLQQAILDSVPKNIEIIKKDLTFIDFNLIENYAKKHLRAARYLASIREQNLSKITYVSLEECCRETNVKISLDQDQIKVDERNIISFLEVLDRRRYQSNIALNSPEYFRASSRRKIGT